MMKVRWTGTVEEEDCNDHREQEPSVELEWTKTRARKHSQGLHSEYQQKGLLDSEVGGSVGAGPRC